MQQLFLAALMYTGTFSGVGLDNLMDRPIIAPEMVLQAEGKAMGQWATGLTLEERDGKTVGLPQKDFLLKLPADLAPGDYLLSFRSSAPSRSADSLWVAVDGQRLPAPLVLSVGNVARNSIGLPIKQAGKHEIEVTLREGPGAVLEDVQLGRMVIKPPQPALRPELAGKHPRLLLTAEDLPRLRARLDDPRVQKYYKLPEALTRKPPPYKEKSRNGGAYRTLGNYALGHVLKPDPAQLQGVTAWLEEATRYGSVGVDLDAEYFLEGLAFSYDWLYNDLPPALRDRVRQTIADKCREVYTASLGGQQGGGYAYQQNHYWFAHLALAMGASAVYGEVPEAADWLAWTWDRFERVAMTFGPDGGFHEGLGYWDYSMPTLYLYLDLYEWCTGLRLTVADEGLKGQFEFRFRHLYPGLAFSAALEDTSSTAGTPQAMLGLWQAKRFHDAATMGLVDALGREASSAKQNLLWLDETVEPQDPRPGLSLARHYDDVETVFARTSWGPEATALAFVSRPMGGHKYAELCAKYGLSGTGHNHPEQNHFVLFGRGEVLAADPGYTYDKQTRNHNTVLVGGKGQYGDGEMWPRPNPGRAHVTGFATEGDLTIAAGDAVSAYPPELGLTRFDRTIVLAGRDLVVVHDRLAAKEPQVFSWLLHHFGQAAQSGDAWAITRNQAQLTVRPLLPAKVAGEVSTYRPQFVHPTRNLTPKEADIGLLELRTELTREATFLVPLLVSEAGTVAPAVQNLSDATRAALRVGDTVVAFNLGEGEVTVPTPWGEALKTKARAVVARLHGGKHQLLSMEGE
ncbi:MAG: DUF4962 domain-containing protein [Armatimonadetes bacterium]|nr:DUF4962 domain-containing protein [Armatimonadota bacterium]